MATKPDSFTLGPAERLVPWLHPCPLADTAKARDNIPTTVLTTIWGDDRSLRWTKLTTLIVDQVRKNKRILLVAPDHESVDALTGSVARALKMAALPYRSILCRYELPITKEAATMPIHELGYEAQMYQFYAKANAKKVALRKKYDRFRELTPILAYKRDKQKDLNEVKLLEWRLLTELSDWQGKVKGIDKILTDYEALPIWKRMGMQFAGKNVETLAEYRVIYEGKIHGLMKEVEVAQARIKELERALGQKTMDVEILEEAVRIGREKTNFARALAKKERWKMSSIAQTLGVSRDAQSEVVASQTHRKKQKVMGSRVLGSGLDIRFLGISDKCPRKWIPITPWHR